MVSRVYLALKAAGPGSPFGSIHASRSPPLAGILFAAGGLILLGAGLTEAPARPAAARQAWSVAPPVIEITADAASPPRRRPHRASARSEEESLLAPRSSVPWREPELLPVRNEPHIGWSVRADLMAMAIAQRAAAARHCQCWQQDRLSR